MAWVRHGTLEAATVAAVELPEVNYSTVEVVNRDGAEEIYFIVLTARDIDDDPSVEGDNCEMLPASMSALVVNAPDPAPVTVKLISAGTPKYSLRAE